ncbi:MAG: hypothetical protein Q9187_003620 [Circinaria calcarea]
MEFYCELHDGHAGYDRGRRSHGGRRNGYMDDGFDDYVCSDCDDCLYSDCDDYLSDGYCSGMDGPEGSCPLSCEAFPEPTQRAQRGYDMHGPIFPPRQPRYRTRRLRNDGRQGHDAAGHGGRHDVDIWGEFPDDGFCSEPEHEGPRRRGPGPGERNDRWPDDARGPRPREEHRRDAPIGPRQRARHGGHHVGDSGRRPGGAGGGGMEELGGLSGDDIWGFSDEEMGRPTRRPEGGRNGRYHGGEGGHHRRHAGGSGGGHYDARPGRGHEPPRRGGGRGRSLDDFISYGDDY